MCREYPNCCQPKHCCNAGFVGTNHASKKSTFSIKFDLISPRSTKTRSTPNLAGYPNDNFRGIAKGTHRTLLGQLGKES